MSKPKFTKREIANLHSSYRSAIYEVYHEEETIQLSIGQHNPNLDRLLEEYDRHTGALITAFNPYSQCLSAAENEQRHRSLIKYLEPLKLTIFDAVGKDQDGVWTPEQSVFILGVELVDARQRVVSSWGFPPL